MRSWMLAVALGLVLGVGCKKHVTVLEVTTDDAKVWDSNASGATVIGTPARGTRLKSTQKPVGTGPPSMWVVDTDNGQGIIYAKDIAVVSGSG